jgi:hypothetical protein
MGIELGDYLERVRTETELRDATMLPRNDDGTRPEVMFEALDGAQRSSSPIVREEARRREAAEREEARRGEVAVRED